MREERAVYGEHEESGAGYPAQLATYVADGVVRILGVLAEVREYRGQPYWQAFEGRDEHAKPFVTYQTAQGHLVPFRHACVDAREVVTWCYLRQAQKEG